MTGALVRGSVVWVDLDPTRGHEQRGVRPALVVSSRLYLSSVRGLVMVVPVTTVSRGWPHHVRLGGDTSGLSRPSFAMTEQPRTISRDRVQRYSGSVEDGTLVEIDMWLRDFMGL